MRVNKIIKLVAGLAVVAVALAEFGNQTGMILAEEDCPCEVRETECCLPSWPSGNLVCFICYKHGCNGPGCTYTNCGPGYYETGGYCRPIGSPPPSGGGGWGGCTIPTHKNLKVDWDYSPTQVRFSWEQIVPLVYQNVYVSDVLPAVEAGCGYKDDTNWGQFCIVKKSRLDGAILDYLIDKSLFTAGTPYFFRVGKVCTQNMLGGR